MGTSALWDLFFEFFYFPFICASAERECQIYKENKKTHAIIHMVRATCERDVREMWNGHARRARGTRT